MYDFYHRMRAQGHFKFGFKPALKLLPDVPYRKEYQGFRMRVSRISQLILALYAPVFSASALAEDIPSTNPVIVKGNYDNAVGTSDASSQGVVTSKLIERRPALRSGELLEFVPGVIVTQHSGDGKANQYFLRGFNLDHGTDFATSVDGIPVNMRTHAHGQGYTDLNFVIPELVKQINYQKGPYYAEDGDFASAGSARMTLADSLQKGIASVTLGENNYARSMLANSVPYAAGTLLYGLELVHNDGPWDHSENFRKTNGILRYSAGNAYSGYNITGMAYSAKWNSTDQIPQRAINSGLVSRFGALDPSDGGETTRYSLSWAMHQRQADSLFRFNVFAVQSQLKLFSNFTYNLEHPADLGDAISGDQFKQAEKRNMYGFNANQTWFGTLAGFDTENLLGLETRYDRLAPVGLYSTVQRQQASLIREDRVKEGSAGLYFQNTTNWLEKFRTIAGLRYDNYSFDVDSNLVANSGKKHDAITSPKLSAVLGPWAKTEIFLNYGQGFHSNDARGTTTTITPKEGLAVSPVTPLVKTRGSEIGLRSEIIPGLQSSLALWRLKIASELVFSGDAGDTEASSPSKRSGIEWNNHYIARPWLLFDLDLAVSKARFTEQSGDGENQGTYIPGSVNQVASFGVSVTDIGSWFGAFQLRYFGPRPLIEDNSIRSSSTTLAYLRAGYKFTPTTQLTLDIFNLFNRKASDIDYYYASRLQGEAADGVNDIHTHPVEPRTVRLTLTHNF
jgi:outer membrane receptor protein involved in Fe transport